MKDKVLFLLLGVLFTYAGAQVYAGDSVTMIEKLNGPSVHFGYPRGEPKAEMFSYTSGQTSFSPFLLSEFLIDTSLYYTGSGMQRYPGIAYDGTNFMAVWMDYSLPGVIGRLIAPDGTLLSNFLIGSYLSIDQPDIVFDGTNYFAVWVVNDDMYGARIKPDGTVIDTNGFVIANNNGNPVYIPAVDYGEGVYLVVWQASTGTGYFNAMAALVDTNGTVIQEFSLKADANWPNVSFDGTNFLTVWYMSTGVWGSRIAPNGTNLDPGGFQISSGGMIPVPAVDFDGTNWFVVWWSNSGFDAAWVTPGGVPFGEFQIEGSYGMWFPEIVLGDSIHWVHGYMGSGSVCDIYATRIDLYGNVLDSSWIPVDTSSGWQTYGGSAYGDSTFIAVWEDQVSWDIFARRYAPDGTAKDSTRFLVSLNVNSQFSPGVAFDGTNYLVVYSDDRNGSNQIYGARIDQAGVVIDSVGFLISQGSGNRPRIAFGDSVYLSVWGSGAFIWGARILPDGTILDPTGFQITSSGADYVPSVHYNNGVFLVVYNHNYGSGRFGVWAARVTPGGQVLDPSGVEIEPWPGINTQLWWPEVEPHNDGFFVTWNYNASPGDSSRIDGTLIQADTSTISIGPPFLISAPGLGYVYHRWHGIARCPGDTFLVVWEKNWEGIYATRVDSSGTVLDSSGIPLCTSQQNGREQPSVAFNGREFFVVWQDARFDSTHYDLFGARVLASGEVLDTNGIELINANYSRADVELVSAIPDPDSGAQMLLAYYGFVDAPYNSKRALGAYYYPPVGIKEGYTQKIQIGHRINISPTISHQKPFIINYSFPEQTEISVSVYDITGRLVKNVYKGKIRGTGKISFTLKGLHQGVYFTRIESKNFNETTKIIWLR